MRVLHVGKYYHPVHGGMETVLRSLAEGVRHAGHQVKVVCFSDTTDHTREELEGVEIVRVPTYGSLLSQPLCPTLRRVLAEEAEGMDLVHVHSPNPLAEFAALQLRREQPLVCTYHADVTRQRLILPAYRPLIRRFLRRCHSIVAATDRHIEHSSVLRPLTKKCRVIPFGLDPRLFDLTPAMRRKVQQLQTRYGDFMLFVGRLVPYKGLQYLIDAASELPQRLLIVGDGPLAARLEEQIEALGLTDRVHLLGSIPDDSELLAYYHACRLFVLPSITRAEAFGMVMTEAMACGKPLVCSRLNSGVTFVNQHEVNGLLADPANVMSLRDALRRVLEDPALAKRLGDAGHARFHAEFTVDRMVQSHLDLYGSILGTPRPAPTPTKTPTPA